MTQSSELLSIFKIISGTPTWVWVILVYLIILGIKSFKTRVVYIPKLFIIPIALSAMKYKLFIAGGFIVWFGYCLCLLLASYLSFRSCNMQKVTIIKETISVELPGTYWSLIIFISFFVIKYIFGYIAATNQALYNDIQIFELYISGLFSGYFLGKAISYLIKFRMEQI